jgi:Lipocalin-like domain
MKSVALRDALIGTWKLVSYVETPVDGSLQRFPLGEKPEGMLLYAPDGYMSAQLMRPGRRKFSSGDRFKGALEEYADEAIGYLAYSGPFHVDEATSTLTHSMTVSLFPGLGQTQPRVAKLEGTRLELSTSAPALSGGVEVMAHLQWERATPNGVVSAPSPRRSLS